MRKINIITFVIFLILLCGVLIYRFFIFNDGVDNYDDLREYTYSFSAKSDTFSFSNGKVYFDEESQNLLINKFKMNNNIEGIDKLIINVYFNNSFWASNVLNEGEDVEDFLRNVKFVEWSEAGMTMSGVSDAFERVNEYEFKEAIKMYVEYCIGEDCINEEFDFEFSS